VESASSDEESSRGVGIEFVTGGAAAPGTAAVAGVGAGGAPGGASERARLESLEAVLDAFQLGDQVGVLKDALGITARRAPAPSSSVGGFHPLEVTGVSAGGVSSSERALALVSALTPEGAAEFPRDINVMQAMVCLAGGAVYRNHLLRGGSPLNPPGGVLHAMFEDARPMSELRESDLSAGRAHFAANVAPILGEACV